MKMENFHSIRKDLNLFEQKKYSIKILLLLVCVSDLYGVDQSMIDNHNNKTNFNR